MHIQIIIGSIRKGRSAKPVADWAYEIAKKREDITVELIDLKEWNLPMFDFAKPPIMGDYEDPLQQRWAEKIAKGDGYIFISPEYNHGYTSVLKNALDYLYSEWNRKPASYISYGGVGGARSIEQLRLVLIELKMAPLRNALHIQDLWNKLQDGQFIGTDKDGKLLNTLFDDLDWWATALHNAKNETTDGQ